MAHVVLREGASCDAEAPETRASLAMFNAWDPDLFVDLHTTDGSYHGYALTYAPSLHPAAGIRSATFGGAFVPETLIEPLRELGAAYDSARRDPR